MAAYVVLMQQVEDVERYREEYVPGVMSVLAKDGAEVLVAGFDAELVEALRSGEVLEPVLAQVA